MKTTISQHTKNSLFSIFFQQICSSRSEDCPNVLSIKAVGKCPISKEEYNVAASKKQCSQIAAKHNCSAAKRHIYHCVINSFRNETLEACAPDKIIFGNLFLSIYLNYMTMLLYNFVKHSSVLWCFVFSYFPNI